MIHPNRILEISSPPPPDWPTKFIDNLEIFIKQHEENGNTHTAVKLALIEVRMAFARSLIGDSDSEKS